VRHSKNDNASILKIICSNRRIGVVELDKGRLGIYARKGQLVNPPNPHQHSKKKVLKGNMNQGMRFDIMAGSI
jgi:hypothetical protein